MRLYRLFSVALFFFILTISHANANANGMASTTNILVNPSNQENVSMHNLNDRINRLESNLLSALSNSRLNKESVQQLQQSLAFIKTEQNELKSNLEQVNAQHRLQYEIQKKRMSDISLYVSILGGILAAAIVFLAISIRRKTGESAKNISQAWLREHEYSIINSLSKSAGKELTEAKKDITKQCQSMTEQCKKELVEFVDNAEHSLQALSHLSKEYVSLIDEYEKELIERVIKLDDKIPAEDIQKFNKIMQKNLMNKSEQDYLPENWFNKSATAYYQQDYQQSIEWLNRVINDERSDDLLIAKALFNKASTIPKLGESEKTIALYDELFNRFGDRDELVIQKQVIKALYNKGIELTKVNCHEEAIVAYDELITHSFAHPEIGTEKLVNSVWANVAEAALVCESTDKVLMRAQLADEKNEANPQNLLVMKFVRFLVNDVSLDDVLSEIKKLPVNTEFTWSFDAIRGYLQELPTYRKPRALAIANYIEHHHDFETLKKQLAGID